MLSPKTPHIRPFYCDFGFDPQEWIDSEIYPLRVTAWSTRDSVSSHQPSSPGARVLGQACIGAATPCLVMLHLDIPRRPGKHERWCLAPLDRPPPPRVPLKSSSCAFVLSLPLLRGEVSAQYIQQINVRGTSACVESVNKSKFYSRVNIRSCGFRKELHFKSV